MSNQALKSAEVQTTVKRVVIDLFEQISADLDRGSDLQDWVKKRLKKFDPVPATKSSRKSLAAVKNKLA